MSDGRRDSSPCLPRIDTTMLRDHGSEERIDRVWDRLERNVVLGHEREASSPGRWSVVATALAAGFAIGVGVSGYLWSDQSPRDGVVMAAAETELNTEVFAAGTQPQRYKLPGGAMLSLEPGSIVDTVRREGGVLTLRLVRGEATLNTPQHGQQARRALALLVGNAQLTPAGSLQVRHDGDTAMVRVIDGSAAVRAPDATHGMKNIVLGPDDEATVPVRVITAAVAPQDVPSPQPSDEPGPGPDTDLSPRGEDLATPSSPEAPTPAWIIACKSGDDLKAAELISETAGPAALDDVTDPSLLSCVSLGMRIQKKDDEAIALLERMANNESGTDAMRGIAYRDLAPIYAKKSQHELAQKYRGLAEEHFKGSLLSAEALCNKVQAKDAADDGESVLALGHSYLSQFPDGPCTAKINELLAKHQVDEATDEQAGDVDDDNPDSDDADGSEIEAAPAEGDRAKPDDSSSEDE